MSNNTQLRGNPFRITASGTTTAQAATTSGTVLYYVTDINGSSTSTTGTWAILCGTTGTTILWQGAGTVNETFSEALVIPAGTVSFYMNGSAVTYANISGYFI